MMWDTGCRMHVIFPSKEAEPCFGDRLQTLRGLHSSSTSRSTTTTTLIVFPPLNLNPLNTNSFVEYVDEHVHIARPSNVRTIPAESSTAASTPKSWVWMNLKVSRQVVLCQWLHF